ncbi:DNA-processing protein DprA [Desulfocurvibacter africanus]|uniref:DNA-processing protein DprA n=1 Tax=Desulfocurvibacter africanus TaxID=873 RepID=UPI00040773A8|nr:DNA-processing protein DprA [Desulfocurvibacter africanus]
MSNRQTADGQGAESAVAQQALHDEYRAALALRHTPGLGPRTWKRIAEAFPTLTDAARSAGAWPGLRLTRSTVSASFLSKAWLKAAEQEYGLVRERGLRYVTWSDPQFPRLLKTIPDPPLYLYYLGDVALMNTPSLALVGSRQCSEYGLKAARAMGEELSRAGITIVSGLAMGIDRQAHLAGLSAIGSSVAVLGTGLDRIYPEANTDIWEELRTRGLIVTEFPPLTIPEPQNFPVRNRIISGLSLGVLVAEAAEKSGSLITAKLALDQGREVFALPGPVTQATYGGCHALIRQGAQLVTSAVEIIATLDYELRSALSSVVNGDAQLDVKDHAPIIMQSDGGRREEARIPISLNANVQLENGRHIQIDDLAPEENAVLLVLAADARTHIDVLGRTTGLASGTLSGILLALELKGLVRQWPGMYYSRKGS